MLYVLRNNFITRQLQLRISSHLCTKENIVHLRKEGHGILLKDYQRK